MSGDTDPAADMVEAGVAEGEEGQEIAYLSDDIGSATRLIDVLRSRSAPRRFQKWCANSSGSSRRSSNELQATAVLEKAARMLSA